MSKENDQGDSKENAFNKSGDFQYQYQGQDIKFIQSQLMKDFGDDLLISEPLSNNSSVDESLKIIVESFHAKPILCVYNLGNYHWVVFALVKDQETLYCLYKDSAGNSNNSLKEKLEKINSNIQFLYNIQKEQISGLECGIFALENMKIIAEKLQKNVSEFIQKFEKFENFCDLEGAQNSRQNNCPNWYLKGYFENKINDKKLTEIKKEIRLSNNNQVDERGEKLKDTENFKGLDILCLKEGKTFTSDIHKKNVTVEFCFDDNPIIKSDNKCSYKHHLTISVGNEVPNKYELQKYLLNNNKDSKINSDKNNKIDLQSQELEYEFKTPEIKIWTAKEDLQDILQNDLCIEDLSQGKKVIKVLEECQKPTKIEIDEKVLTDICTTKSRKKTRSFF